MHRDKRLRSLMASGLLMLGLGIIMVASAGSGAYEAMAAAPLATPAQSVGTAQQPKTLVMRVYFRSTAERDILATELGAEEVATTGGYLTVVGDQAMYNDLLSRGLRVEVDQAQTQQLATATSGSGQPNTFYGGYKTVEDMQAFLDSEVAAHPGLAQKVDYGNSWCKDNPGSCIQPAPYNGYDLYALRITNQAITVPKPVFVFAGGNHVREIVVPEVAMRYISYLLDNYNSNPDARWLVDYQDTVVVPIMNPDGHHIVEAGGGGNSPYYQRKNANNSNGCTVWPPSSSYQFGTDLNRNFPFMWNCCGGSTDQACGETYRGPSVNSEPETQAFVTLVSGLIPDQRGPNINDQAPITTTGMLQDMHASGGENLYPWGMQDGPAPNGPELANIGAHMSATNASPQGNGYEACQPTNCLYTVDGDSSDWGYGVLGIPAFTAEIGDSFQPPYSQVDGIWQLNRGMLLYSAKVARAPYLTSHGPDTAQIATNPMTVTQGIPSQLSGMTNYAWAGNAFSQNVGAAEYYVDTPPWAGGTPIPMMGNFTSPTVPVTANIDTSGLAPGRHVIFVRGRGVNQFQGYDTWGVVSAAFLDVLPAGGATATATATNVAPTLTATLPVPTLTTTATAVSTFTAVATGTTQATSTTQATGTVEATSTTQPSATSQATSTPGAATQTATTQPTVTACTISFSDVPPSNTFYTSIQCLACKGIVSGYDDGTFRPNNQVTRGQIAKIVALSAGLEDTSPSQLFEDVPSNSPFYRYINALTMRGYMGGYACGSIPQEPCDTQNRPYFRPGAQATRGQISKIISNAAGIADDPGPQIYTDVPSGNPFYDYINRLTRRGVMGGYACGSIPQEPCDTENRPYFRWGNNTTRGQASKIDANTFFPNCLTTPER